MNIQVGDRITYKNKVMEVENTEIVYDLGCISTLLFEIKEGNVEIIKIERPQYREIEEKKELLTEEEKADLKDIIENVNKYNCIKVNAISFRETNNGKLVINCFNNDYCMSEMVIYERFKNLNKSERYTLKELGLEEK